MRTSIDPFLVLEGSKGSANDLIEIKTGKKNRNKTKLDLITNIENWMKARAFDKIKDKYIDLAIVAYVSKKRMKTQDVDNIAKLVIDSLNQDSLMRFKNSLIRRYGKCEKANLGEVYLLKNDSQIRRLLVYKIEKTEVETKTRKRVDKYDTDSVIISFREHNPKKEMTLVTSTDSSDDDW